MRINPYILLVLLITQFATVRPAISQNATIKGRVFNNRNNEPLPFVNIVVWEKPNQGTTTDIDGNFTITGLEPGYIKLLASCIGFEKFISEDVLVTNAKIARLDIPMKEIVVTLKQVEIKASAFNKKDESPVSLQTLTIAEIERNPGSNRDISKVIQSLPGVLSTVSYRNDVVVRGGGPGENRFYLDGVEIPNLNHFSTQGSSGGPVGIINVDFIREVEFYSGAFPASRGNALSSVIDFWQIDGNREKMNVRASVGASDLSLTTNGPLGTKSTYMFSYRRSYLQFLFSALGLPFLPAYNDYQLKYKWNIDKNNQLSVISVGALDQNKLNTGIKNPDESQRFILGYLPSNDQWNYTFGLVYRHFRPNGSDTWVLSRNMLDNEQLKYKNNVVDQDSLLLNYVSREIENKFRYERLMEKNGFRLMLGGGGEYDKYSNKTLKKLFMMNELLSLNYNTSIDLFRWYTFGQLTRSVFNERLTLSAGLRADANSYSPGMNDLTRQLSPRFSASYVLAPKYTLNLNVGKYFEAPPYTMLGYKDNQGDLVNKSNNLKYISADHYVLGIEYLPDQKSKMSVEGFYKSYRHYPFSVSDSISMASKGTDFGTYGDEAVNSTSRGRSYGLELLYRNEDLGGFHVMICYTLVTSEFTNASGKYVPSTWDSKHLMNITLTRMLKRNWQAGMKWRFAGGAPYTPYDEQRSSLQTAWDAQGRGYLDYSRFNTLRLKPFHQLDVRIDKEYYFDKWSLMFYLDIQNLYNFKADRQDYLVNTQEDGSVQTYVGDDGKTRYKLHYIPSSGGTILPTVGIMVEF
jgi:outer membrane receptor for ferrienterochelin and colicin